MKHPLIQINSEQFTTKMLDENCSLKEFYNLTSVNIDPHERNIFVEAGRIKVDGLKIHDIILMDKVKYRQEYIIEREGEYPTPL